jgi:hypothetical protein
MGSPFPPGTKLGRYEIRSKIGAGGMFDGTLKQALAVHLGQSPFLNLFGDERVRETRDCAEARVH